MKLLLLLLACLACFVGATGINFDDFDDEDELEEVVRYGMYPLKDYAGVVEDINNCKAKCSPLECVCCTYRCRHNGMLWKMSYCKACPRNELCALEEVFGLNDDSCLPASGKIVLPS